MFAYCLQIYNIYQGDFSVRSISFLGRHFGCRPLDPTLDIWSKISHLPKSILPPCNVARVPKGYQGLLGVTKGYQWLPEVTRGYPKLP